MELKDKIITDLNDIEDIICNCQVLRIGMCINNKPYIVPLNYGYEIENNKLILYCHSINDGKKLDILRENPNVFIDIHKKNSEKYFTVMCDGNAEFIDIIYDKITALDKILSHCTSLNDLIKNESINNINLIKITCSNITCKIHEI